MPAKRSEKGKKGAKHPAKKELVCTVCGKPTVRLVDGEPSCDEHAALVYENQLEDYTSAHRSDKEHEKV